MKEPKLQQQEAARSAWTRLNPRGPQPRSIDVLEAKHKSLVVRLGGVGLDGRDVIAKRCTRSIAAVERAVYAEILPRLPAPAPQYYGAVDEGESVSWLFIEDVGGVPYSPNDQQHRELAGSWLGALHGGARRIPAARRLPPLPTEHYRQSLEVARANIAGGFHGPALTADDRVVLEVTLGYCGAAVAAWGEIEAVCARIPSTLAHNDFRAKNVRIRNGHAGPICLCFDWEHSGWGTPAADLAQFTGGGVSPDLHAYYSIIGQTWPHLSFADVEAISRAGSVLRLVASLRWASQNLTHRWLGRTMVLMTIYQQRLATLLGAGQWRD